MILAITEILPIFRNIVILFLNKIFCGLFNKYVMNLLIFSTFDGKGNFKL